MVNKSDIQRSYERTTREAYETANEMEKRGDLEGAARMREYAEVQRRHADDEERRTIRYGRR